MTRLSWRKMSMITLFTFLLTELGVAKSRFGLRVTYLMIHQVEILKNGIRIGLAVL